MNNVGNIIASTFNYCVLFGVDALATPVANIRDSFTAHREDGRSIANAAIRTVTGQATRATAAFLLAGTNPIGAAALWYLINLVGQSQNVDSKNAGNWRWGLSNRYVNN